MKAGNATDLMQRCSYALDRRPATLDPSIPSLARSSLLMTSMEEGHRATLKRSQGAWPRQEASLSETCGPEPAKGQKSGHEKHE